LPALKNCHLLLGTRIASDAGAAPPHHEGAEPTQLDERFGRTDLIEALREGRILRGIPPHSASRRMIGRDQRRHSKAFASFDYAYYGHNYENQ
jgi:hypothetical protein